MIGATDTFLTSDGVRLEYDDNGGDGIPLILLHGWGQTRAMFREQRRLGDGRRIVSVDFRGHGCSEKPDHGYRIARFAADLRDLVGHVGADQVDVLGWSMGASVIWSYLDLFGTERIRSIVLVDQPAAVAAVPWMSETEQEDSGAIFPVEALTQLARDIHSDTTGAVTEAFVRGMFSGQPDPELWDFVAREIQKTPAAHAATLLFDHGTQNWLDVLPRINRPTLVIGCHGSHVPADSQRFIADRIPGATLHVFGDDVARSHFPFLENPAPFNAVVERFLDRVDADQFARS